MTYGELKDVVREHFARTNFPTTMLNIALDEGRRIIESHANFWWMRDEVDFVMTIGANTYSITDPGGDLSIEDFKDARALSYRVAGTKLWLPVDDFGETDKEEADSLYDEDTSAGSPEIALVQDDVLVVYPNPNLAYETRLYVWVWTANPTGNLFSDELTTRWPMSLVYAALVWGYEQQLKDFQGASYWRQLLGGTPFGRGGELAKLKRENFKREWKDKVQFTPRPGPGRRYRRLDNLKLYR